jgi:hypothetical protein
MDLRALTIVIISGICLILGAFFPIVTVPNGIFDFSPIILTVVFFFFSVIFFGVLGFIPYFFLGIFIGPLSFLWMALNLPALLLATYAGSKLGQSIFWDFFRREYFTEKMRSAFVLFALAILLAVFVEFGIPIILGFPPQDLFGEKKSFFNIIKKLIMG